MNPHLLVLRLQRRLSSRLSSRQVSRLKFCSTFLNNSMLRNLSHPFHPFLINRANKIGRRAQIKMPYDGPKLKWAPTLFFVFYGVFHKLRIWYCLLSRTNKQRLNVVVYKTVHEHFTKTYRPRDRKGMVLLIHNYDRKLGGKMSFTLRSLCPVKRTTGTHWMGG
jgi:hypothetical protein